MVNKKTNRTEGVYIKVNPEIKADISRRVKLGFNLSKEFEKFYTSNYMIQQELEKKIHEHKEILKILETSLAEIDERNRIEAELSLSAVEIIKLRDVVTKFNKLESQRDAFNSLTNKNMNKKKFGLVREKYVC